MRIARLAAAVLVLLATTGCISSTTLIRLNADGSGTIEQTILLSAAMVEQLTQMMTGMAEAFGGEDQKAEKMELFQESELRNKATELGEGVTFVSHEPIKTEKAEGARVVYAFEDVTKLRISQKPSPPGPAGAGGMPGATPDEDRNDLRFRFERAANGHSILTVVGPEPEVTPEAEEATTEPGPETPGEKPGPEQLAQMRKMFEGLKIAIAVEVAGKLVRTTSPYVDGNRVTLLEMDFAQLLEDPEKLELLAGTGPGVDSIQEAKGLLKDVPGIKVILDPETTIEFTGR